MGIGDLFSKTWDVFTKRVLTLLGLNIMAIVAAVLAVGIFIGVGALLGMLLEGMRRGILIGSGVVAGVAGLIAYGWCYGAFVFATVDVKLGFGAALKKAWQRVGSFIWVFVLVNVIVLGGFGLFFIPGVLFGTWFSFALLVFAKEGVGGMDALLKSREYVRGHFWGVFLRFIIVALISVGLGFVPFIGTLLSIVYAPFMMLFIYNMYADLRVLRRDMAFSPSGGQKTLYVVLGLLGWIMVPIIFLAIAGAAVLGPIFMKFNGQFPFGQ